MNSMNYTEPKPELEFQFSNCVFSLSSGVLTIVASRAISNDGDDAPERIPAVCLYAEVSLDDDKPSERWQYLRDNTKVIYMRGNITEIPYPVFNGFVHLHTIVFPEALRGVGYLNFKDCPRLKFLYLPKNVKNVAGLTDINSLLYIDVAEDNKNFCSVNGCLMSKDGKKLIAVPGGLEVITIPDGCEIIGQEALTNSHTGVVIPASVRKIHPWNFYSDNLKEIALGDYAEQLTLIQQCFTRDDSSAKEYADKLARINIH